MIRWLLWFPFVWFLAFIVWLPFLCDSLWHLFKCLCYDMIICLPCFVEIHFRFSCYALIMIMYAMIDPCLSLTSSGGTRTMSRMAPKAWHSRRGVIDLRRSPLCVCIICDHYWPFMRVCDQSSTVTHTYVGSVWMHPRIYVYVWLWWPGGVCLAPLFTLLD